MNIINCTFLILNIEYTCNYLSPSHIYEAGGWRGKAHIYPDNHFCRKKKLYYIKLRLSEFLPLLNHPGTLFTLMYYELSFPSL